MIKTILVPTSGSETDDAVFDTALAVARLFEAHLDFCHVRLDAAKMLQLEPHASFALGPALRDAIENAGARSHARSMRAAQRVREFCARERVAMTDAPAADDGISASWYEHGGPAQGHLLARARHSDLVVMGRSASRTDGLPPNLLRVILLESGHPVLVSPLRPRGGLTGTVMLCWKETRESVRAVAAAMPFLAKADRVIAVAVEEGEAGGAGALADLARQMAWHRIRIESRVIKGGRRAPADVLAQAAAECGADLLVMGGYGHSPLREDLFGGCTRSFLDHAEVPVLALH